MGPWGLHYYVKERCERGVRKTINMCDAIETYKLNHGKNAIIIFDFGSLVYSKCNGWEGALGGRPQVVSTNFKIFFEKLIKSGADLVFFCDGQLQSSKLAKWCKNRNESWKAINDNIHHRDAYLKDKDHPCHIQSQSLQQIIRKHNLGHIYTSTDVECDRAIVKYAHDKGALAIIASDMDFLIFQENYEFWDLSALILEKQEIKCIDRTKLRKFMNLTSGQMKILATIVGNDFTKVFWKTKTFPLIDSILYFCRNTDIDAIDKIYSEMIRMGFVFGNKKGTEIIRESLEFYDITRVNIPPISDGNFNFIEHVFKNEFYFQFDASFFDFKIRNTSNGKYLMKVFLEVYGKLGGIILCDKKETRLKIVTKWDLDEDYEPRDYSPNFDFAEFSSNDSWIRVLGCLGLDSDVRQYLDIVLKQNKYVLVTLLSILFLRQAKEITKRQAVAMLIVHNDISLGRESFKKLLLEEKNFDFETVRTAQLFLKVFTLVLDSLHVCGLRDHKHPIYYDGVLYFHLMKMFEKLEMEQILSKWMKGDSVFIDACRRLLSKY